MSGYTRPTGELNVQFCRRYVGRLFHILNGRSHLKIAFKPPISIQSRRRSLLHLHLTSLAESRKTLGTPRRMGSGSNPSGCSTQSVTLTSEDDRLFGSSDPPLADQRLVVVAETALKWHDEGKCSRLRLVFCTKSPPLCWSLSSLCIPARCGRKPPTAHSQIRAVIRQRHGIKSMTDEANPIRLLVREAITLPVMLLVSMCQLSSVAGADLSSAEATFKSKCAMCHGLEGKGKRLTKTRPLGSADVQKQSDAELTVIITRGKPPSMPAYKSMTQDEVKQIIKYIRSLKK